MIAFLTLSIVALLLLGFPMFVVLLLPTLATLNIFFPFLESYDVINKIIAGVSPFPLVAIPLFIYAADIMMEGKMSERLIDFTKKLVGHMPGGLAHTTTLACGLFGAISGSTQAAVAAIGSNMRPVLMKKGYDESFSTALIINASDLAQLIPPSIFMIMFGVITGASIAALFIAGIVPGILLGLAFMAYSSWWAKKNDIKLEPRPTMSELFQSFIRAAGPLGLVFIIIGGIYSGAFSPSEAAAIAVGYNIVFEVLIYRKIKFKDLYRIAFGSAIVTALVYILVGAASAFGWMITLAHIPELVTNFLVSFSNSKIAFLFIMNAVFFIALMLINPLSAMVILTPLFFPLAQTYGVDPLHMGALITLNAAIGSATPPFGTDIFTAVAIFDVKYETVLEGVPPFLIAGIIVLVLVTLFPFLSTFLPNLAF